VVRVTEERSEDAIDNIGGHTCELMGAVGKKRTLESDEDEDDRPSEVDDDDEKDCALNGYEKLQEGGEHIIGGCDKGRVGMHEYEEDDGSGRGAKTLRFAN
jgi:hypothetical protein